MLSRRLLTAPILWVVSALAGGHDLLDSDVAFRSTARWVKSGEIEVRYNTAPGYYLYRDRLQFAIEPETAKLGKPRLPQGKVKQDEFFGKSVIYRKQTIVRLPVSAPADGPLTLTADLQGCADIGVCYPPVRRKFTLAAPSR